MAAITAEIPKTHSKITGCNTLIFCLNETIIIAAIVAANVAIMHGIKIEVGLAAFREARIAIMLTGISVNPEACKHKNMICEFEAVSLFGLSSCRLSIALMPKGVAALSRPKRLAEKFITICPMAG